MSSSNHVLAVDLHSSSAVALFCRQGRLLAVGSLPTRKEASRKEAARQVLCVGDSVDWLVSAGTPSAQATWERVAMRQGVRVQRVGQPDWQAALLEDTSRTQPLDERVLEFARGIATRDGLQEAQSLSLAEARAVCIGVWAHHHALGLAGAQPALMAVGGRTAPSRPSDKALAHKARLRRVA